ncbi:uncharacterized protein LOC124174061 [Ischnura elegans]|uniref:uncharacterized protein LOC124174061 n=1 Tax=Ischnura elegans TaxID=197161 RepID=UPI001ED899BE|nr:uncharacterized protein LOC124174061 [Ischnura elegans]
MECTRCKQEEQNLKSSEDSHSVTVKSTVYNNYWVKFSEGKIEIGRKGETLPIISFNDGPNSKKYEDSKEKDVKEYVPVSSELLSQSAVWKKVSGGVLPHDAVQGGDNPNRTLYVGRAYHEGELLPGKICREDEVCYVPLAGEEHAKTDYEVLTGNIYEWIPYQTRASLVNAVPGGKTSDGTTLYIGRTMYENTVTPGKVYPWTGLVYIGHGGLERTFRDFEILVFRSKRAQ